MRGIFRLFILVLFVLLTACGGSSSGSKARFDVGQPLAFPGAEGFGADATGGRGGQVIKVTNLNDSGSGSLRAAVQASGPRIVIFEVGGRINLDSAIVISNSDITIAGQTAPGGGIELANGRSKSAPFRIVGVDNVIIRNVRIRPGPGGSVESILTIEANNIIIDHTSMSWTTDETFNTYVETFDLTLQNSIVSESLDCSTHTDGGCHGTGVLLGSRNAGRYSIHHNLTAHHGGRNPRIGAIGGVIDFVNNVVYNWGAETPSVLKKKSDVEGTIRMNFVGNYYEAGPDSDIVGIVDTKTASEVYIEDNISPTSFMQSSGSLVPNRHPAPTLASETSATQAYDEVLANAGANMRLECNGDLFYDRRDSHDQRAVSDVQNGTGGIIDDPSEVGGYQPIAQGSSCSDNDNDGMPDAFEDRYGLNKNSASDANGDVDNDGYLNIEEYLNGTSPQ